jgi:hypothetical protein
MILRAVQRVELPERGARLPRVRETRVDLRIHEVINLALPHPLKFSRHLAHLPLTRLGIPSKLTESLRKEALQSVAQGWTLSLYA